MLRNIFKFILESNGTVGVFFRTSGVLFHIDGPMKESAFCPMLVFQNGKINFI